MAASNLGFFMCTQMLMRVIAHRGCTNTVGACIAFFFFLSLMTHYNTNTIWYKQLGMVQSWDTTQYSREVLSAALLRTVQVKSYYNPVCTES